MSANQLLDDFRSEAVLENLHGFQRDAVERAFHQLYMAPESTRRYLIADEVGLGKTLIAKGILAKALEHLRDSVERIDVVYICSNLRIARQNINRLNPIPGYEFADAARVTLLPLQLGNLAKSRLNFIAFTPGTSLDLKGNLGVSQERMLLYALLAPVWQLHGVASFNVLQGGVQDAQRFRDRTQERMRQDRVSPELAAAFHAALDVEAASSSARGCLSLQARFDALCGHMSSQRRAIPDAVRHERNQVVGGLRALLARTCIDALEPDVVILDEFQRFRDLLTPETDQGELANQLFDWSTDHAAARTLLLSATPYKAYSLQHELAEEDHYADFLRTIEFLDNNADRTNELREALAGYRRELFELRRSDGTRLLSLKATIEAHLKRVMSRTERVAVAGEANGMLRVVLSSDIHVTADDLRGYCAISKLTELIDSDNAIEYWKSAAYPLNFIEGYQLKGLLADLSKVGRVDAELLSAVAAAREFALPYDAVRAYRPLPLPNARMRELVEALDGDGAFDILWLPPSLPYYPLEGAFARVSPGLTKRLVFSAWQMVPRSLACMLSYEAERRALGGDEPDLVGRADARRPRTGLLRFSKGMADRLTGMPVMTLLYPSRSLAVLCDPRLYCREQDSSAPDLSVLMAWAEERVRQALPTGISWAKAGEAADESWYWVAPMLLDQLMFPAECEEWWAEDDVADQWSNVEELEDGVAGVDEGWQEHVHAAREVVSNKRWPTGKVPHDLLHVMVLVGLSGPATAALRGLLRLYPDVSGDALWQLRMAAAQIGWGFRSLLNRPESMALVRKGSRRPYWIQALEYATAGCLSSVLDEYLHVLRDACGVTAADAESGCLEIAEAAVQALQIRATTLEIDDFVPEPEARSLRIDKHPMRSLFAMRFGSQKAENSQQVQRDTSVGTAFNSPFWPFVLATTSVGQEGLDFHWYCHAVVHWNLPSNPVDLEQREGRVHRFKGHAIRKNVATRHGAEALRCSDENIWAALFNEARRGVDSAHRGLVPYWLYPIPDGACIERHIPMFALSRDQDRLKSLQRSLGAYRMVFGQPRQDELLAYLMHYLPEDRLQEFAALLSIDLSPPRIADSQ